MKKYANQKNMLFLSLVSVLLGFALMVSIHTYEKMIQQRDADEQSSTQQQIAYIKEIEAETTQLELRITETRAQLEALQMAQQAGEAESGLLAQSLAQLKAYAGQTELTGPGIIITLDDNRVGAELAQKSNPATYNAENYIIHDKDLLYTVRALASVAEAVSINGVRVIDTSSIRCVGTVIMINSARQAAPYIITVLGDPDTLTATLKSSNRYTKLTLANMPVKVTSAESLTVPAYTGTYPNTYSTRLTGK